MTTTMRMRPPSMSLLHLHHLAGRRRGLPGGSRRKTATMQRLRRHVVDSQRQSIRRSRSHLVDSTTEVLWQTTLTRLLLRTSITTSLV